MIRIILLSSSYPSVKEEVSRDFMTDFADSLMRRNIRVFVICPHKPGLPFGELSNNISIIRFPYWFTLSGQRLGEKGGIIASLVKSPIITLQIIPFIICQFIVVLKTIRRERIDLIHSHWIIPQGFIGAMVQLCARIPHVTSIHGTDIHIIHKYSIMKPLIKFIAHFSNAITANSNHTFRLLKKNIGVQNKIIRKIPMGINIQEYEGIKPFKNSELKTVLFVGRLIALKGISNLIKAIKIVQSKNCHVELIIIGEGPKRFELEKLANELSISSNTHFYGNINREKLYQSYKSADVLVLPSTIVDGQTEGLGVVLLEAMASGTPVIGSNTGGIPDIIEDGVNGLLVTPGDPQALADAIIRILENPDLADRFRKAGLETVRERFSWDVITDQFVEVYQEILKESHHE